MHHEPRSDQLSSAPALSAPSTSPSPWIIRDARPDDEDFLVFTWLKSFARTPLLRDRGANKEGSPAELVYWAQHRPIVMRLLQRSSVRVLCSPDKPLILAWAATEGHDVVHYILARHAFHTSGDAADMFRELLGARLDRPCRYSHDPRELGREQVRQRLGFGTIGDKPRLVPAGWTWDPWTADESFRVEASRVAA